MAQSTGIELAQYEREKIEQIKREYDRMQQEQYLKTNPLGMGSIRNEPTAVYGIPMELIAEISRLREQYRLNYHEIVGALRTLGKIKEGK